MVLGVRTSGRTAPSELFAGLPSSPWQTTTSRPIRLAIPTHRTRKQVCMLLTCLIPPSLSCPETVVPNPTSDGKRCPGSVLSTVHHGRVAWFFLRLRVSTILLEAQGIVYRVHGIEQSARRTKLFAVIRQSDVRAKRPGASRADPNQVHARGGPPP